MEDQGLMIRCQQCGEMNRLPVVHCKKCGAKLDFDSAEAQVRHSAEKTFSDHVRTGVKIGAGLAMVLLIGLTLWPARFGRTVGMPGDAERYRRNRDLLVDALNRAQPASQKFTEAEINAYFEKLVSEQPKRKGMKGRLKDMGVRIADGRAEAFVSIGRGPLTFTSVFRVEPGGEGLEVVGAKAGHLPLPGALGKAYAASQAGLLRQMRGEARVLRNMGGVSLKGDTAEILVKLGR